MLVAVYMNIYREREKEREKESEGREVERISYQLPSKETNPTHLISIKPVCRILVTLCEYIYIYIYIYMCVCVCVCVYSDTHQYWIHVIIFCYNSSLCSPFCLIFGKYYLVKLFSLYVEGKLKTHG